MCVFFSPLKPVFVQAVLAFDTSEAVQAAQHWYWSAAVAGERSWRSRLGWEVWAGKLPAGTRSSPLSSGFCSLWWEALQFLSLLGCGHRTVWGRSETCGRIVPSRRILFYPWLVGNGGSRVCLLPVRSQKTTFNLQNTVSRAQQVLQHYPVWWWIGQLLQQLLMAASMPTPLSGRW